MRTPGTGELEHAARHLAVERGGIEVSLSGDGQVGPLQPAAQARPARPRGRSRARSGRRGRRARPPARPPPAAGEGGDVDAGLTPVAGRDLDEALAERHDLRRRGALLRPEHGGGVTEACRHVAGDDELDPPQCRRRSHGLVRAEAAVGRRGTAAADHDPPCPASRAARRSWPTPAVVARTGSSCRGLGSRARPAARDISTTAVRGSLPFCRSNMRHSASTGAPRGPVTEVVCGDATDRQEQALASVGHRHLVGGPSGGPGRVGHGGRHLPGGRRPPEFVGRGDEVGHAMKLPGARSRGTGVRARGFEPPPPFGDRDLNPARLPIPPRPQRARRAG